MTEVAKRPGRTVAELMTSPAITASPGEKLGAAARRMAEARVGSLVVLEEGRLAGILTERDLLSAGAAGVDPATGLVGEWMTSDPDVVEADAEAIEVWRSLAAHGYRHIPVVAGGELKGVVSLRDLVAVSQLRPVDGVFADVPKGLEGVVAAETAIGSVRGLEGFFHYRQYDATELARRRSFEEVWQLVFDGALPESEPEAARFRHEVSQARRLPPGFLADLRALSRAAGGARLLASLRTAICLLGAREEMQATTDLGRPEARRDALHLAAAMPVLATALYRASRGKEPIEPDPSLPTGANYLYMLTGEVPSPERARAIERYLSLTVDHGLNASTFTARVVASTGADLAAAVSAGMAALSGPLHGGAPSRALDTLDAIGRPERAEAYIRAAIESGERIMGFGHRVYKTPDPRAELMKATARELGGELVTFAEEVEATVVRLLKELKPDRQLYTNVEFYAGVVMELCGIPRPMFTPTFAVSRTVGWCAHVLEQVGDNRLIRPSSRYVGPPPPKPVPAGF